MDVIKELLNANWTAFILLLFVIASSLKYSVELYLSIKKILRFKTGKDIDKENEDNRFSAFENRISTLEKHDNWQYQEISKMSKGIEDIKYQLSEKERADKERTVATLRNQLYGLHAKFSERGYVDNSGLKTFTELGKIYEAAGGDDIYHEKLKPEVLALPIHDD